MRHPLSQLAHEAGFYDVQVEVEGAVDVVLARLAVVHFVTVGDVQVSYSGVHPVHQEYQAVFWVDRLFRVAYLLFWVVVRHLHLTGAYLPVHRSQYHSVKGGRQKCEDKLFVCDFLEWLLALVVHNVVAGWIKLISKSLQPQKGLIPKPIMHPEPLIANDHPINILPLHSKPDQLGQHLNLSIGRNINDPLPLEILHLPDAGRSGQHIIQLDKFVGAVARRGRSASNPEVEVRGDQVVEGEDVGLVTDVRFSDQCAQVVHDLTDPVEVGAWVDLVVVQGFMVQLFQTMKVFLGSRGFRVEEVADAVGFLELPGWACWPGVPIHFGILHFSAFRHLFEINQPIMPTLLEAKRIIDRLPGPVQVHDGVVTPLPQGGTPQNLLILHFPLLHGKQEFEIACDLQAVSPPQADEVVEGLLLRGEVGVSDEGQQNDQVVPAGAIREKHQAQEHHRCQQVRVAQLLPVNRHTRLNIWFWLITSPSLGSLYRPNSGGSPGSVKESSRLQKLPYLRVWCSGFTSTARQTRP